MNVDVAHSLLLIAAIAVPTATVVVVSLRRYADAHGDLIDYQRSGRPDES